MSYREDFPWIKFAILTIPFSISLFIFAPTFKWKMIFGLIAAPAGVALALAGKSMRGRK